MWDVDKDMYIYSRTTGRENKGGEKRMAYDSLWFTFADIV